LAGEIAPSLSLKTNGAIFETSIKLFQGSFNTYICICVGFADVTCAPGVNLAHVRPYIIQMLREPAARGARNKGCYFWSRLSHYFLGKKHSLKV
jgi:hypothetical protein